MTTTNFVCQAVYLVPNQAWVVLWGSTIETATLLDIQGKRFFGSLKELAEALDGVGLEVRPLRSVGRGRQREVRVKGSPRRS